MASMSAFQGESNKQTFSFSPTLAPRETKKTYLKQDSFINVITGFDTGKTTASQRHKYCCKGNKAPSRDGVCSEDYRKGQFHTVYEDCCSELEHLISLKACVSERVPLECSVAEGFFSFWFELLCCYIASYSFFGCNLSWLID